MNDVTATTSNIPSSVAATSTNCTPSNTNESSSNQSSAVTIFSQAPSLAISSSSQSTLGFDPSTVDPQGVVNLAVVLQALHDISTQESASGLVKLIDLQTRLRTNKQKWPCWSRPANEVADGETIRKNFIMLLEMANLAHAAGRDAFKPGPAPEIGLGDYKLPSYKIANFSQKPFDAKPYVCPGCYARFRGSVLYTVEQLSTMMEQSLADPQPEIQCECAVDKRGRKKCGGKGNIGSCPKVRLSDAQLARMEGFKLFKAWLKLKISVGRVEWRRCPYKTSGSKEEQQQATPQNPQQRQVDEYFACEECLAKSRVWGVTKKEGLCAREVSLLVHRLMLQVEKEEGVAHCLCRDCLNNPASKITKCRRRGASVASSAASAASSKRIDENIALISDFVRQRNANLSVLFGGDVSMSKVNEEQARQGEVQTDVSGQPGPLQPEGQSTDVLKSQSKSERRRHRKERKRSASKSKQKSKSKSKSKSRPSTDKRKKKPRKQRH